MMGDVELYPLRAAARLVKDAGDLGKAYAMDTFDIGLVTGLLAAGAKSSKVDSEKAYGRQTSKTIAGILLKVDGPTLPEQRLRDVISTGVRKYPGVSIWHKSGCEDHLFRYLRPDFSEVYNMDDAVGRCLGTTNANHLNEK